MFELRKATEQDRNNIAYCIADAYYDDFKDLKKSSQIIASALQSGIQVNKFYVAVDSEGIVAGILAISDCTGRSVLTDKSSYRKYFGFIIGSIVNSVHLQTQYILLSQDISTLFQMIFLILN